MSGTNVHRRHHTRLCVLFLLALGLSACLNPAGGEFTMADAGNGLPDPNAVMEIYSVAGDGASRWEVVHDGLPRGDWDADGLAASSSALYLSVNEPREGRGGIYRRASGAARWELYLDPSGIGYDKATNLAWHPDDGNLYFLIHGRLFRVPADAGRTYSQADLGGSEFELVLSADATSGLDGVRRFAVVPDGGAVELVVEERPDDGSRGPEFLILDVETAVAAAGDGSAALTSTGFRAFSPTIDDKPHVSLFAGSDGTVYYETNYSGLYRWNGSWEHVLSFPNEFTDETSVSIGTGLATDGTLYASYERTPTTQIASFFRYNEGAGAWEPIHQSQGYGPEMIATGDGGAVMSMSGRFGVQILDATSYRTWQLPWAMSGLGLSDDETRGVRFRGAALLDGSAYLVQHVPRAGYAAKRVIRANADTATLPFTTRNLNLDWGIYTDGAGGIGHPVETTILHDGTVLSAYNTPDGVANAFDENGDFVPYNGLIMARDAATGALVESPIVSTTHDGPNWYLDLDAHPAAAGFAVATTDAVLWYPALGGAPVTLVEHRSEKKRVDVGSEGTIVALLDNGTVAAWNAAGTPIDLGDGGPAGQWLTFGRSYVEDVAVSDAADAFYVVGFDNKTLPGGNPVQVAYLEARALPGGSWRWQRFGFDGADLAQNIADTRLYHVEVAGGHVVVAGESAGTQTIFRYDGERSSGDVVVREGDFFNALWNTASAHISYVARFGEATGAFANGQLTMARLQSDGGSNTLRARSLAVDADGRIYLGGVAASAMANRDALLVNELPVAEYGSTGDQSLLVTSGDQRTRHAWATFKADLNGGGDVVGLAARDVGGSTIVAALMSVAGGGSVYTGSGGAGGSWSAQANSAPVHDPKLESVSPYLVVLDADANFGTAP